MVREPLALLLLVVLAVAVIATVAKVRRNRTPPTYRRSIRQAAANGKVRS